MLDIAWSEVMVILVVALVVIGPKDIPAVLRTVKHYLGKLREVRSEFSRVLDEVVSETGLQETREELNREIDTVKRDVRTIVDMDGNIQETYDLTDIRPDIRFDAEEEAPLTTQLMQEAVDFEAQRRPVKKDTLH